MKLLAISRAVSSSMTLRTILMFLSCSVSERLTTSSASVASPVSSSVRRPFRHRDTNPIHSLNSSASASERLLTSSSSSSPSSSREGVGLLLVLPLSKELMESMMEVSMEVPELMVPVLVVAEKLTN